MSIRLSIQHSSKILKRYECGIIEFRIKNTFITEFKKNQNKSITDFGIIEKIELKLLLC